MTSPLSAAYQNRTPTLRPEKVPALTPPQALDRSQMSPAFVRKQFREGVVADLKAAVGALKALGVR